jgi:hypothetical protein
VHTALRIDLGLIFTRDVRELGPGEDVEVVVGGVATGVAFSSDCSSCPKVSPSQEWI